MITLSEGLQDISKELGESTTNTTARRIQHYCDAIQEFANERKWRFLTKKNATLTTGAGLTTTEISLATITDIRMPGGIKELTIADVTDPFKPCEFEERFAYSNQNRFYINPDEQTFQFTKEVEANKAITIWHFYVPERIESLASTDSFPIPTRYRKALGTLGACFVQWSRYLDGQGNRLLNVYNRLLAKIENNQSERSEGNPLTIPNPRAFMSNLNAMRSGRGVRG